MYLSTNSIQDFDADLYKAIEQEKVRQELHIELIASENYASPRVLEVQGSVLTNKYAEGYPGKRYYGGCEFVDKVETLAIERAKTLFGAAYANVQPHAGSQANAAVYFALLKPGDTVLGMDLASGGHLTHGSPVNFSGSTYHPVTYGVNPETGLIDYDNIRDIAKKHRPKMIIAGFTAYSRTVDWACFRAIADEVGAYLMVDMAHIAGLVAAGVFDNPVPFADVVTSTTHKTLRGPRGGLILAKKNDDIELKLKKAVFPGLQGGPLMHVIAAKAVAFKEAMEPAFKTYQTNVLQNAKVMAEEFMKNGFDVISGGTDNHLMLVSLVKQGVTGKDAEAVLGRAHITLNKNAIPNDPASPFVTSGVRVGTPAITTRGFGTSEVRQVAKLMMDVICNSQDEKVIEACRKEAEALCRAHPVYTRDI